MTAKIDITPTAVRPIERIFSSPFLQASMSLIQSTIKFATEIRAPETNKDSGVKNTFCAPSIPYIDAQASLQ